jgi:hypothetical protein
MINMKQIIKSKTFTFSSAYFAVFEIFAAYDVEIPQRAMLGGFVLLSWILRGLTTQPLNEK